MKVIRAALISALLIAPAQAISTQQKQGTGDLTDRARSGLVGPVYALKESQRFFSRRENKWEDSETHTTEYYDRDGNLVEKLKYAAVGAIEHTTYIHNGSNELVEKTESIPPAGNGPSASTPPAPSVQVQTRKFKYRHDGKLVETQIKPVRGGPAETTEYKYDDQGRVKQLTRQFGPPGVAYTTVFEYDAGKLETQSSEYAPYPRLLSRSAYKFEVDSHGNWIKKQYLRPLSGDVYQEITRTISYYSPGSGQGVPIAGESPNDPLRPSPPLSLPKIIRKSGGVLQASAIRKVEPAYPLEAQKARITGQVMVEIVVGEDGKVIDAYAITGPRELAEAAAEAASQWEFAPTRLSGVPVKVIGQITFIFEK
ncbi:MAG TPA: TonB family protein [Blastocatellia bacterium]|nr:TonB family protein [Blastocatellia bacterium]